MLFGQRLVGSRDSGEPQDFFSKTMQSVARQPIKKIKFCSNSPESLLATNRWPKSVGTLGARLGAAMVDKDTKV